MSISLSRKADSYCPRPRRRSQAPTSMIASNLPANNDYRDGNACLGLSRGTSRRDDGHAWEGRPEAAGSTALKRFAHSRDFNLLVDRRGRMGGIQQLLLAQTDPLQAFGRNLERGHERVADRIGSSLA
jgi:hypothetical protein